MTTSSALVHENRLESLQPGAPGLVHGQSRDEERLETVPESYQGVRESAYV